MNYNYPYNPNPYSNYNAPNYMNPQYQPNFCSRCSNQGFYMDPYGNRLDCYEHIYPNPNVMPPEDIYNVHYKPENIISRTFHAIKDCITCGGRGFVDSFRHPRGKYCYDCIRASGYCPKCNNTGFKLSNGKRCKCGLY